MGDGWTGPGKSKRIETEEDEQNFEGARESGGLGWDRQDRNRHETLSFSEQARCSLSVLMGRHYPFIRGEVRSGRGIPVATAAEVPVLPPYRLVSTGTLRSVFTGPMASRPTPPGFDGRNRHGTEKNSVHFSMYRVRSVGVGDVRWPERLRCAMRPLRCAAGSLGMLETAALSCRGVASIHSRARHSLLLARHYVHGHSSGYL